jgi:flagellar basal-body rod modification protein FlgD
MSVGSIGASASSVGASQGFADLSSEQFMDILISELQNQDPLDPQDTTKLLEQLSSLRTIESQTGLQDKLENLVKQNQVSAASNLIGKVVQGVDSTHSRSAGRVVSVRVTQDGVFLELDNGRSMQMSQVTAITDLPDNATEG